MEIKITRIDKSLPLPAYQTEGSVAFDMYSRQDAEIEPGQTRLLPSNLIVEVPAGYALLVAARSSLVKRGLMKANGVGVIDQDYHGPQDEIGILLYNFTTKPVTVVRGQRIAQGLVVPVERIEWDEVENMTGANRGGFGSTEK